MWPRYHVSTLWNVSVWVVRAGVAAVVLSGATTSWLRRMSKELSLRSADYLELLSQPACPAELITHATIWALHFDTNCWFLVLQVADRYRLTGDILDGQIDLDILNVRRTDSGLYCCRVDIDGVFNDKKVIMNLRVVKGEWFFQILHQSIDPRCKCTKEFCSCLLYEAKVKHLRKKNIWNNCNAKCILVSFKAGFLNKTFSSSRWWCTFLAGSSDHHFDSNNYHQQSHRAADLHRWDPLRSYFFCSP